MTGLKHDRIIQGIESVKNQHTLDIRNINQVNDYKATNELKIERIILSYINYVKST